MASSNSGGARPAIKVDPSPLTVIEEGSRTSSPMGPQVRAVLAGMSLLVVSQLGVPGVAGAEPPPLCLADQPAANSCDTPAPSTDLLGPEAITACLAAGLPDVFPSVKQAEEGDGSTAVIGPEPDPGSPEPPQALVASLSGEGRAPNAQYQVEDNHHVQRFLDQFQTGYRRAVVERWLFRAGRYLPMVLDVFKQKGLPEELVFTAMIESGFDPLAASRAGARGLWQFMAPTARRYGLRVDRWMDERLDPEKSTMAAARHFVDLYAVFGSWNLAQAAYNAGERTVLEAIRGMGTSDFWLLARGQRLKDETKNFVPAIQAATLIAREPERYGFVVTPAPPLAYELVAVPRSTSLKRLASKSGIELDALERLNPELRLKETPPEGSYALKVPVGTGTQLRAALEGPVPARQVAAAHRLAELRLARAQDTRPTKPRIHIVKPQENLTVIAKRYGVSVADIVRWNELGGTARIVPGTRLRLASTLQKEHGDSK
jgi:membrane-bound lytic murein transglycosylase D